MSTTIRKNATKRIESLLRSAIMIREYRYDDMGDKVGQVDVERVLFCGQEYEFRRVYVDDAGTLHLVIHGNWSFTAYATVEGARRSLTPQAFAKYFPEAVEEVFTSFRADRDDYEFAARNDRDDQTRERFPMHEPWTGGDAP